jgi:hypothetical protein
MNSSDMFLCCFKGKTVCVRLEKAGEENIFGQKGRENLPSRALLWSIQYKLRSQASSAILKAVSVPTNRLQQPSTKLVLRAYHPGIR